MKETGHGGAIAIGMTVLLLGACSVDVSQEVKTSQRSLGPTPPTNTALPLPMSPKKAPFRAAIVLPENGTTNHVPNVEIAVDSSVRPDGKGTYSDMEMAFSLADASGKLVAGKHAYSWTGALGSERLVMRFVPTTPLKSNAEYTARIVSTGDVVSGLAAPLPQIVKFRVGSMPRVRKIRFAPKSAGAVAYAEVVFSEAVDKATVATAVSLTDEAGVQLPVSLSNPGFGTSDDGLTYLAPFSKPIDPTSKVRVEVAHTVAGTTGVLLDGNGDAKPGTKFSVTVIPGTLPLINGAYERQF